LLQVLERMGKWREKKKGNGASGVATSMTMAGNIAEGYNRM